MIICSACNHEYVDLFAITSPNHFQCPSCGYRPCVIDGFISWAPELASANDHFPLASFEKLFKLEENSFWFRSRNALILWSLKKYAPQFKSLLEIGCGTGFVLNGISNRFHAAKITGSEIYSRGLSFSARRLPEVELVQLDARNLPYVAEFDVIGAFDVIEHITEDELVLANIHRALKPHGFCLVTVPQHVWLWSEVDESACHQRRYSASELHSKFKAAGFEILRSTSFVTLLLPFMMLARLPSKLNKNRAASDGLELNRGLDKILEAIMFIERAILKLGISLPIGGSRFVIARKTNT